MWVELLVSMLRAFGLFYIWDKLVGGAQGAATATVSKITDNVSAGVQNGLSNATGGIIPPKASTASSGAQLPNPSSTYFVVERITNRWLCVWVAVAALTGSALLRQTRGLGRDIGSGVSTTREAVKTDFGELHSDPGAPTTPAGKN